jgi:hypothetical protein
MNRSTFMVIAAAVGAVTGLAALLAPAQLAAIFGVTLDDAGLAQERLLGGAYLGISTIVWFAKDIGDAAAQRAVALGNVVSWALGLVVTVAGLVAGLAGQQSWLLVALEVAFTAAWAYFAFMDRTEVVRP